MISSPREAGLSLGRINELTDRAAMGLPESFVPASDDARGAFEALRRLPADELARRAEDPRSPFPVRSAAGALLGLIGDPRVGVFSPAMSEVPSGEARIGLDPARIDEVAGRYRGLGVTRDWIAKEAPAFRANVQAFRLGTYPVTNAEYRAFLAETGRARLPTSWEFGVYPAARSNHPVYTVAAEDADAYAAWLAGKTGRAFRLPTEIEWEYAAAGPEGREFPWGEEFLPDRANTVEHGPLSSTPVGIYPLGRSWCGALDMAGNVEEYVADDYRPYPGSPLVEDDLMRARGAYRVARGGGFTRFADLTRCKRRHGWFPKSIYVAGFRLAETI